MALPRQEPHRHAPLGVSDAVDGSEVFAGAMSSLGNLVAAPHTRGVWVPRPAGTKLASLVGAAQAEFAIGNIVYGMATSAAFPGKDEPFAYNLLTNVFLPISGVTSANLPVTQSLVGDTVQPTLQQIGGRVVFTHPGFPGGFTSGPALFEQVTGNTHSGSNLIDGLPGIVGTQIGMSVMGANIPPGTTITAFQAGALYQTTATGTSGNNFFTVASAANLAVGQLASGFGLTGHITIIAGTTITVSANLTQNLTATPVQFTGNNITMSANATGSTNSQIVYLLSVIGGVNFGWLDISGFSITPFISMTNGFPVIAAGTAALAGVQPGMTVTAANIPGGTHILASSAVSVPLTGTTTTGSNQVPYVAPVGGFAVGFLIFGAGIPAGAVIAAVDTVNFIITMSLAATASATVALTATGSVVIISANATATAQNIMATIAGGTAAAPQWGAGDMTNVPLQGVPVFVEQFNGRAYYGVNVGGTAGVAASDPGFACLQSSITQTLTFLDGIAVTAASGLALFNQLGGIVQSLMVFQGASNIRQITGDFSTNNIVVNSLQTATGTLAPNSITQTPQGLLFIAPDGLRLIDFDARVSDPIGWRGEGISMAFVNAVLPTRMAASYNEDIYRITTSWQPPPAAQAQWGSTVRRDEFWYHLDLRRWSGPHSLTSAQNTPWQATNSFVISPDADPAALYRSDPFPSVSSVYTELAKPMTWTYTTTLMPDNPEQMAVCVIESSIFFSMGASTQALVIATDDQNAILDETYIFLGPLISAAQRIIAWHKPLIFRQMSVSITGTSSAQVQLGALSIRAQMLDYMLSQPQPPEFILGTSVLGGADVLGP